MLTRGILIFIIFFSRISHSYVAILQPQRGAFQWTSPPSQGAGIIMATAKYISRIPVSPQFWHFYTWSYSGSPWISSPAWNAGSTTTESSVPKYNAGLFKSRRFRSQLPARNPRISSPTWNARRASSWIATTKYDFKWSISHWSWRINPYPLHS